MGPEKKSAKRLLSFDVIRIVALLLIIMVHVGAYIVINYPDSSKTEFFVGNIFNGLARAGVPMFVMLSGALLLNEDKPFEPRKFYKTSFLWLVLLLIGWVIAYAAFYAYVFQKATGGIPSMDHFWNYLLLEESDYTHVGYLFMITGLYLMIPIFRLFVQRKNRTYIFWFILGSFLLQNVARSLNTLIPADAPENVTGYIGNFRVGFITGYVGYLFLGWYLANFKISKNKRCLLYIAGAVSIVLSIILVRYKISDIPLIRAYIYDELGFPAYVYGMAVFVFIQTVCGDKLTQSKWIKIVSECCFGIYIIHVAYLEIFTKVLFPYANASCGVLAYILITYTAVFTVSLVTVLIVGKIPYLRKIFHIK